MKKLFYILIITTVLLCFASCDDNASKNKITPIEPVISYSVTYNAGAGSGESFTVNVNSSVYNVLPNSTVEVSEPVLNSFLEETAKDGNKRCLGFTRQNYSFYGWQDEKGIIYQYSDFPENNPSARINLTGNVVLTAIWKDELSGEFVTADQIFQITGILPSIDVKELMIPRVFTKWEGSNHQDYLVSAIKENAFKDNTTITTVVLPDTIKKVKSNAFSGCSALEQIEFRSNDAPVLADNAIPNNSNLKIYVPENVKEEYKTQFTSLSDKIQGGEAEKIKHVTSITLNKTEFTLEKDGTETLVCTVLPIDAANKDIKWSSTTPTVADVDSNGKVKALTSGTTKIIATSKDNGLTAECLLTVTAAPENNYLTFSSAESFSITPAYYSNVGYWDGQLEYSTDLINWSSFPKNLTTAAQANNSGVNYYLYLRGTSNTNLTYSGELPWTLNASSGVNCSGNIMTLLNYEDTNNSSMSDGCFAALFNGCTSLTNAPALPATSLTKNCYQYMFFGCTSLVSAPVLPATSLAKSCYEVMFSGCSSLVSAPSLPATNLADSCYNGMFSGCTSLTNVPEILPATSLTKSCYEGMFSGCSSLVSVPSLPATNLADSCYNGMFNGCTSLENAPALPATSLTDCCYESMFDGCTSLVNAPVLSATNLASTCYRKMFCDCTSLTNAPALPAVNLADSCYHYMFDGCTNLVVPPSLPATSLASSCYLCMFTDCSNLKVYNTQVPGSIFFFHCPTDGYSATGSVYCMFEGAYGRSEGDGIYTPTSNTDYYYGN